MNQLVAEQLRIGNLIAYRASLAGDNHSTEKTSKLKWLDEQISQALGIPPQQPT